MKTFTISFNGRPILSHGKFKRIRVKVSDVKSQEEAMIALYKKYEHITRVKVTGGKRDTSKPARNHNGLFVRSNPTDKPRGWYKTDSPKSPLQKLPSNVSDPETAKKMGYRPYRGKNKDRMESISVITSITPGFRGVSSKAYVSIWYKA